MAIALIILHHGFLSEQLKWQTTENKWDEEIAIHQMEPKYKIKLQELPLSHNPYILLSWLEKCIHQYQTRKFGDGKEKNVDLRFWVT